MLVFTLAPIVAYLLLLGVVRFLMSLAQVNPEDANKVAPFVAAIPAAMVLVVICLQLMTTPLVAMTNRTILVAMV